MKRRPIQRIDLTSNRPYRRGQFGRNLDCLAIYIPFPLFSPSFLVPPPCVPVRIYALISPGWPVVQPQLRRCTTAPSECKSTCRHGVVNFRLWNNLSMDTNRSSKPGRELELINWNVDVRFEEQRLFYGRCLRNCHTCYLVIISVILLIIFDSI